LVAVALLTFSQNSKIHAGGRFSKTGNGRERAAAPPPSNQSTAPRSSSSAAAATDPARGIGDPTPEEIGAAQRQRGSSNRPDAPAITRVYGAPTQTTSQYDRVPRAPNAPSGPYGVLPGAAPAPSGPYGVLPGAAPAPPVPVEPNNYGSLNQFQRENVYEQPWDTTNPIYNEPMLIPDGESQNSSGELRNPNAPLADNPPPEDPAT
jgi:hypothetical protein